MRRLSCDEIKKIELDILIDFDRFCKEKGLRYCLSGGTLLGAIRHKGFIPWDDDIDLCMPRPDFEILIDIFNGYNPNYEIRAYSLGTFDAPFCKIVDKRTRLVQQYTENNVNTNIWIDIMPIDGLPENVDEVKEIYKKMDFLRFILMRMDCKLGEGKNFLRIVAKYFYKPLLNLYGKKRCINKMEGIAKQYSYEGAKYVGAVTWGLYGIGERMLKIEFEERVEIEFEGYKFYTFSCWDSYLRGLYKNYMQLPPEEKRISHELEAYITEEE